MGKQRQRRRKQKERRHEYEYVYLDETGAQVAVEEAPKKASERKTPAARQQGKGKVPKPPTVRSVGKQAAFFFAILALAITIFPGGSSLEWYSRVGLAAVYTIVFLPGIYFMERFKYRTYMKRTGQLPPKAAKAKPDSAE